MLPRPTKKVCWPKILYFGPAKVVQRRVTLIGAAIPKDKRNKRHAVGIGAGHLRRFKARTFGRAGNLRMTISGGAASASSLGSGCSQPLMRPSKMVPEPGAANLP